VTARNKPAFDRAQELHGAIKTIMAAHSPLAHPLTAYVIRARLPPELQRRAERTIRKHMQCIRDEAPLE
jgi:hypothetical protein